MNKQDFCYIELVQNNPSYRGKIVKLPEGHTNYTLDYYGKEVVNGFSSAFLHTKHFDEHVKSTGSVRNYSGSVFSECLYWDMDNISIEKAQQDTIELVERLKEYSNNIRIYFSGNKGFHIVLIAPELEDFIDVENFAFGVKKTCSKLAKGLISFDNKIYDNTRILRITNSKHPSTNLYKIPITYDELKTLTGDEIKTLASNQRKIDYTLEDIKNPELTKLIVVATEEEHETKATGLFSASELLTGIINGFESGQRNSAFASIAGMLHNRNIDDSFIYAILQNINKNNSIPLSDTEIERIVSSISRYQVNEKYAETSNEDIVDIKQAGETWFKIITTAGYCSFGERFKHINERMKLCIPGDTIGIVANSGVGKTSWGLELGNEEAKQKDTYSLLASLEMSRAGIFFRTATMEAVELCENNYVPQSAVASTLLKDAELASRVYSRWKNLKIVDRGGLTLDQIVDYFKIAQDIFKGRVSNLVIDYAQNIFGAEDVTYAAGMARRFKDVAKTLETKLFVLMQCNKTIPDDYTEIQSNHLEGAGAYRHAMDYIIAGWKSHDQTNRIHCKFLKERWGDGLFKFDMVRDGMKYHTENFLPDVSQGRYAL